MVSRPAARLSRSRRSPDNLACKTFSSQWRNLKYDVQLVDLGFHSRFWISASVGIVIHNRKRTKSPDLDIITVGKIHYEWSVDDPRLAGLKMGKAFDIIVKSKANMFCCRFILERGAHIFQLLSNWDEEYPCSESYLYDFKDILKQMHRVCNISDTL